MRDCYIVAACCMVAVIAACVIAACVFYYRLHVALLLLHVQFMIGYGMLIVPSDILSCPLLTQSSLNSISKACNAYYVSSKQ